MAKGEPNHGEYNDGKDPCAHEIGYWPLLPLMMYMYQENVLTCTNADNRQHMYKDVG